jgi:hypothetical protein
VVVAVSKTRLNDVAVHRGDSAEGAQSNGENYVLHSDIVELGI